MRNQSDPPIVDPDLLAAVTGGAGEAEPQPVPIRPGMVGGGPINLSHAEADKRGDPW